MTDPIFELAGFMRGIAGQPFTLLFVMRVLGGRATDKQLMDITGWSLPTVRKHMQTCMFMGYVKQTESYHAPVYFFDDGIAQLDFLDFQSEKLLHIGYSSSSYIYNNKDIKQLTTSTSQSEKTLHIDDLNEEQAALVDKLVAIGIWRKQAVSIAELCKWDNDIADKYFYSGVNLRLAVYRLRQGAPPPEKVIDVEDTGRYVGGEFADEIEY